MKYIFGIVFIGLMILSVTAICFLIISKGKAEKDTVCFCPGYTELDRPEYCSWTTATPCEEYLTDNPDKIKYWNELRCYENYDRNFFDETINLFFKEECEKLGKKLNYPYFLNI